MTYLPGIGGFFMEGLTRVEQPEALRARSANSSSITAPSEIVAGDLLLMVDHSVSTNYATPTGWTTLGSIINSVEQGMRHQVHWRVADGTEGGTSITGMSTSSGDKLLIGFRGNKSLTASPMNPWTAVWTSGNPSPQVVPANGQVAPLVVIGTYGGGNVVDPRTMSPAKDGEYGSANSGAWIAWKIYLADAQDVTVDMDNEFTGWNFLTSGYFTLK